MILGAINMTPAHAIVRWKMKSCRGLILLLIRKNVQMLLS